MGRRLAVLAVCALAGVSLVGCGSDSSSSTSTATAAPPAATSSAPAVAGTVTVLAAASLTEPFTELGERFEAEHPGATVRFSFGASSALATQITSGAPADVFASASDRNMQTVVDAGLAAAPKAFAANTMTIVVPTDNPADVTSLADLANPDVKVALCEEQVPCGDLAARILSGAGLSVRPVTYGADVKAVLTTVRLGEVDAGIVYVTDARAAAGEVTSIEIPAEQNAATTYPIAALADAPNPQGAQAFVDFVLSEVGQSVLAEAGFSAP